MALIMSIIGSILGSLFGQNPTAQIPESEIVCIEYTEIGTMAGYQYYGKIERLKDGTVQVEAMQRSYDEIIKKKVKLQVLADVRNIVVEHKIYAYKKSYEPAFEVLDGEGWHLEIKYADGQRFFSGGTNAWPPGKGLAVLRGFMVDLVTDAKNKKK